MCNPKVRPFIHFYPEDTGPYLSEARQGRRWLKELRPEETTPMVRIQGNDYYIYEPAMLNNFSFCIPTRWFTRKGVFFARAWILEPRILGDESGWVVREDLEVEVRQDQLLKNFLQLGEDHERYRVPHPSVILGKSWLRCSFFLGQNFDNLFKVFSPRNPTTAMTWYNGHIQMQFSEIVGGGLPRAIGHWRCRYGYIVTIRQVTLPRSGTNIIVFCLHWLAYHESMLPRNTMSIFFAHPIWRHLWKWWMELSVRLSAFLRGLCF